MNRELIPYSPPKSRRWNFGGLDTFDIACIILFFGTLVYVAFFRQLHFPL